MKFDEPAGGPGIEKLVPPAPGTMPVGPPGTFARVAFGMLVAGVIVDVFEPWLAGHQGEVALDVSPHGLTSSGSTRSAGTIAVLLETMFRTVYRSLGAAAAVVASARLAAVVTNNRRACTATGLLPCRWIGTLVVTHGARNGSMRRATMAERAPPRAGGRLECAGGSAAPAFKV